MGVAGQPATAVLTATAVTIPIRGTTAVTLVVRDGCSVPVSGAAVGFTVVGNSGGSAVTGPAATDASGQAVATLTAGAFPGLNVVRADVTGGTNPTATVTVEGMAPAVPTPYLSQNSFNPAKGEVLKIRHMLPGPMPVEVRIYSVAGELIRRMPLGVLPGGLTVITWDGRTDHGGRAASGGYLVQVRSGGTTQTLKVVVVRH